jgi:hypothetical protein
MSEKLNPIQQKIEAGMHPLAAFLSQNTCGEACWEAREDVCRCKCGGKNHGCMRTADGTQPQRMAKIDGLHYKLAAVGEGVYEEAKRINDSFGKCRHIGSYSYGWSETEKGAPARVKKATKGQLAKWPELAAAREAIAEVSNQAYIYTARLWPYLLWVREDGAGARVDA